MTLELITKATVLAWPILVALAVLASLFMPDRDVLETKLRIGTFVERLWQLAIGWFVLLLLVLSTPHKGDVGAIAWSQMGGIYSEAAAQVTAPWAITAAVAYAVGGLGWAITYFWLYARRLGLKYVMERDLWLQANNLDTLEGLSSEQRKDFTKSVLDRVKGVMLYEGDFPLRAWQQKRFFGANLTFWPATMLCYFVGDFAMDVARRVWFALRNRIHGLWVKGMAEYIADDALCAAFQKKLEEERLVRLEAARREEEARVNSGGIRVFMPGLTLSKD
jgi:hypothetical protein